MRGFTLPDANPSAASIRPVTPGRVCCIPFGGFSTHLPVVTKSFPPKRMYRSIPGWTMSTRIGRRRSGRRCCVGTLFWRRCHRIGVPGGSSIRIPRVVDRMGGACMSSAARPFSVRGRVAAVRKRRGKTQPVKWRSVSNGTCVTSVFAALPTANPKCLRHVIFTMNGR